MSIYEFIVQGLLAGLIATVPMSLFMWLGFIYLPRKEKYPLPPKEITEELAEDTGLARHMSSGAISWLSLLCHFSYGAVMGGLYGFIIFFVLGMRPSFEVGMLLGITFGIMVWTISYLLALPILNILTPATEHPARRNILMIFAHIVWGAILGWVLVLI